MHDLRRIVPERNMARFYRLLVQPDLFGGACLVREWGRIGSPGTVRSTHFPEPGAAEDALAAALRRRERRHYQRVRPE